MKWSIFGGILILLATTSAEGAVIVMGEGTQHQCYEAARFDLDTVKGIADCDIALAEADLSQRDRAATLDNRGILKLRGQTIEQAMSDFDASIAIDPTLGDPYVNKGVAFIMLKRYDDAIAVIEKGIAAKPTTVAVGYYNRAIAEEYLGKISDAYHDYQRALIEEPAFASAQSALKRFKVVVKP